VAIGGNRVGDGDDVRDIRRDNGVETPTPNPSHTKEAEARPV
jgi:hypothetical protein